MNEKDAVGFPRSVRLRTPQQFKHVFSQGRRISAALFRLHVLTGPARETDSANGATAPAATRLGISVSKRAAALAIARNRIKRIARESFRHRRAQLPPGDYVLLAQREAAEATPDALRAALLTLWQRAAALKPMASAPTMPAAAGNGGESS